MQIDLKGRTALVTGSSAGIGHAIATSLARAGARVLVNGRDEVRAREAAAHITELTGNQHVHALVADVATAHGANVITAAESEVDILVNNAGVFAPAPVFEVSDGEWRRYFEVNVLSGIRLARHYIPHMTAKGWGRVVFISSDSAVLPPTEMVHYGMTKTAQLAVSRGMAQAVAGTGVTVNSVLAGPTLTPGVEQFITSLIGEDVPFHEAERRFITEERPTSLIRRLIRPEEIANLVLYLSSDHSSATTGGALRVDGGVIPTLIP
ncbi:oxidoreductase [Sphaerisporangium siamense]|uniref:NAD(P)-dependent dehydrogenase (Short-subunit alcohol dehydrogenase family) n=1 Tax=Sphaerisporangium siamense TaxID=795645 RepID=A0A7W7DED0_9ACTN|nr:SDR family oxidoreductase [Sphaerisporangium siamense]MBB4705061.1 NAD(P)-dependent dehydrogenase (short-subunit alcohol dehydrogenase family) [Sphaerisporangium siamense]GII83867.1 oxidoreductase [Sphaerisporangium siamense]